MKDRDVINAFVEHLGNNGFPGLKVDRWPDTENRQTSDIDAIAGIFAIEHTSIDTLPKQRRNSDWYMQIVGDIEKEISGAIPFRLNITIMYDSVLKGQNWAAIHKSLKTWIIVESPRLADGRIVLNNIPGIPFSLQARKASDRPPGIYFARTKPNDNTLSVRIRKQFDRKAKKLAEYLTEGKTTVLLIENDDIALMNEVKIIESIRTAYPDGLPNGVDKIWYADTSSTIPNYITFMEFKPDMS